MKLCFISNPNLTHTRRWLAWFARRGHEVCLLSDTPLEIPWTGPRVEMIDLPKIVNTRVIRYLPWAIYIHRFLRNWRPNILHAHRVSSAGWLGAFSGFQPLVITPWGSDLYLHPQRSPVVKMLAHYSLSRARLVTVDATDLKEKAIHYGASPERTHIIQWGVDVDLFQPAPGPSRLRASLGLDPGPVILSIRSPTQIYNIDIIVEAIPQVLARFPTARFVLRNYNGDPATIRAIEQQIKNLEIDSAILWLDRLEPWERAVEAYQMADLAISVPSSDSTPVSVLEAMACKLPVIASDLPALREWIHPGREGLLIPPRQSSALASAIIHLLEDRELRLSMGQKGREVIEQKANHDMEMKKMESLYESLLA